MRQARHILLGLATLAAALLGPAATGRAGEDCDRALAELIALRDRSLRVRKHASHEGMSEAQRRNLPPEEACVRGPATPGELLAGLARAKAQCAGASAYDDAAQQSKIMININESFMTAILSCPDAAPPPDWTTRVAPAPPPPPPAPPPRAIAEPRPAAPVAPPAPPVRANALPCVEILRAAANRYTVANSRCRGSTVLAVIEKRGPTGATDCKVHTITGAASVPTLTDARPQINFECILAQGKCTRQHVASMFPECD